MSRQFHPDELVVRFLLGQLSEEERSALEERFFKDDAVFEDLEIAEDELIERYLDHRLGASDLASFEQQVAAIPRLRERVVFARMLAKKVDAAKLRDRTVPEPAPVKPPVPIAGWWERLWATPVFQRPVYRMALVAALLLLVLGSVGWWIRQSRLETQRLEAQRLEIQRQLNEQLRAEREREEAQRRANLTNPQQPSPAPVPTETPSKSVEPAAVATLVLFAGGSRSVGGGKNELLLAPDLPRVRLTLNLEDTSYTEYVVQFRGLQSTKVFTKKVPHRQGSDSITVELHAVELPTDDYTIQVDGVTSDGRNEPVSNYTLRVRRR